MEELRRELLIAKHKKFQKICVPTLQGFELLSVAEILYLEGSGSYTDIYISNGHKVTSTRHLGFYENELLTDPFIRVHQSHIVNVNKVQQYLKADNGYVIMVTGKAIRVSRSKKNELVDFFTLRRSQNIR